ncbi:amidase [Acetobacter sp. DmW_043]|uniref:amidase n=1 Tax=Acetobacter sp. DmW_043 TaxID=1670658 RepID=UPI000A3B5194|nr:amidase [Acetobacter sp. DmW_043]OUI86561.1 amidase [Acetobacter sp. DmW_043]
MTDTFPSLFAAACALAQGKVSSRHLTELALARIHDKEGEGSQTFSVVHADSARKQADLTDTRRRAGEPLPPLAGLLMSVKDLFDEAGSITRAGSVVLSDAPPAQQDAPAIALARQAGLISIGRTTMTEFAFSGVGMNPHTGTPANPWDRANRRIPGGSSSGAAVSVSDGMAFVGIGSDTGGSCRIPAALTGLTGYKPTASRISTRGTVPLSSTLDSVGSLGRTVSCCWAADRALAGLPVDWSARPEARKTSRPRLGVLQSYVLDGMDDTVASTWHAALKQLEKSGAILEDVCFSELENLPQINRLGGFPAPESLAWHAPLLEHKSEAYDPFVLRRILRGKEQSAVDYLTLQHERQALINRAAQVIAPYDALIMPTVPVIAPHIADLVADETLLTRTNLLLLRNPTVANFINGCAISLPCHAAGAAPAGLMAMQTGHKDSHLFHVAAWLEEALRLGKQ